MKLYHAPKAVNPERTYNFLKLKGKLDAVEIQEISIMQQEHKSKDYRALSPYAQVPVLILDDGSTITESRAISTYFETIWPEPNLMGQDAKEKALIEMWDRRIEFMFMMQIATWFRNTHPMMAPLEVPQVPEAAEKAETRVRKFVATVDRHLGEHEWLAADRFSIADLTLYLTCGFAGVVRWKPQQELEHLGAHYAKVQARLT
ncbi:MAG: glutathione S-transferase N-terminal domain-containing protein [Henriciella sp.]|nr:glutathione S-transferase N-terminal domain-containing protein [Henriciella sp.]